MLFNKSKKIDDFYQSSSDWAYDMYHSQTIWLRRSLIALILMTILLFFSLTANLFLFPLKEKVPYLYAFDKATGEITKIGELEKTTLSSHWSLTRYLLIQYIINYESYDFNHIDRPYQLVYAQSSNYVKTQYENFVKSDNPNSPYQKYSKDKFITVRVISINRLNENTVDVKFEKILHDRISNSEQITQREAILKWEYQDAETTQKMLDRDPLGFKVTYYQTSQINIENH